MKNIICIGDSLTYGFKVRRSEIWTSLLEKRLINYKIINSGINGDSTTGMLTRFNQDVLAHNPSYVIIMGGSNDFIMGVPLSIVKSNIATMSHHALSKNIIPIIGIQPVTLVEEAARNWPNIGNFKMVNEYIAEYRDWVYLFSDNFHINILDFYKIMMSFGEDTLKGFYSDGIHLNSRGNSLIAERIDIDFL